MLRNTKFKFNFFLFIAVVQHNETFLSCFFTNVLKQIQCKKNNKYNSIDKIKMLF